MLGYTEAELIGRAPIELTHPEDVAATAMASERIRRGESDVIELEKRFVRKDGGIVWTILRVRRHRGRDGNPDLLIAHILDITRRKAAEREIAAERKLLDEAREREVATGQEIQRSLLIGALPAGLSCADIAGFAEASRGIDGDFYGFTTFRPDCFEVLIGDVMGKGIPAALVGAGVRATYHQVVTERLAASVGRDGLPPPAEIMNGLHRSLTPRLIGLDTFVTMALYRFDVAAGTMTYVNAGHTAGVLMHPDGRITPLLGENPPMGVVEDEHYVELTVEVAAGDALTVYSDGITEARASSGAMFGERRLHDFLVAAARQPLPASTCLQALRKVVGDFAGGAPLADDQMAVMVRLLPLAGSRGGDIGHGEAEVFDLPWSAAGLEPLRRRVAAAAAWLGEDAADRLVLAAFEAATNVVRHVPRPSPEATLACRITPAADRVSVEIWYIGLPFERQPEPDPDLSGESEGGFGLYIIDRAVSEVAYESPLLDVCCTRLVQIAGRSVAG
jgi:phosphoserine phosphatase RsbU/P